MSSGVELSNVPSTRRTVHAEDSPNEASIGSKQSTEEDHSSTISSESLEQAETSNSELGNFLSDYHKGLLWKKGLCKEDGVSYISVPKQWLDDLISKLESYRRDLVLEKFRVSSKNEYALQEEKLRLFRQARERDEVLNQELTSAHLGIIECLIDYRDPDQEDNQVLILLHEKFVDSVYDKRLQSARDFYDACRSIFPTYDDDDDSSMETDFYEEARVFELETAVAELEAAVEDARTDLEGLVLDKEELMSDEKELCNEKEALEQKLANAEGEITKLKAAFAHLADKHGREQTACLKLVAENSSLRRKESSLRQKIEKQVRQMDLLRGKGIQIPKI